MINKVKLKLDSSFGRARLVSFFTDACSLLYHIIICIVFYFLDVKPVFYFNFLSITVFTVILILIPKFKSYVLLYMIAATEVIAHQMMADHFLGTETCFHCFILLMGLLPFLVFEDKFKLSVPITIITSLLYIIYENIFINPKYVIDSIAISIIRIFNISITVFIILFMILIYTIIVFRIERNLKNHNIMLEKEIKMAAVIQQNFFKQDLSNVKKWKIAYFSKPKAGVSGDLFDFYNKDGKLDGLGIFDVSGHGISSGLVTMLVKNIITQEFYKDETQDLWEVLNRINDRVIEEKGDIENYLTGILVRINKDNLEMVCAGHPNPIYYNKKINKADFIESNTSTRGAIGIADFPTYYESQYFDMDEGDALYFYSDGLVEVLNENDESFGKKRLAEIINETASLSVDEQSNAILKCIEDFCGTKPQNDDITLIILRK